MSNMLAGKLAFVTGAGSGIGRATCKALAREGAKVIAADQNFKNTEDTVALLDGTDHLALHVDVSQVENVQNAFTKILEHYEKAPTILVNAAGIAVGDVLQKLSLADFDRVMDVNLKGTFMVMQIGVNKMLESSTFSGGAIVNISSTYARTGSIGLANYSASKAGIENLTKSAAMEYGRLGVRVNVILPGLINTAMPQTVAEELRNEYIKKIPLGRIGQPEEVAELILFLVSEKSSYVNGASIDINGGPQ